jgi:hypothetical protein
MHFIIPLYGIITKLHAWILIVKERTLPQFLHVIYPNIQDVTTCFSCSPADVNVNFSSTVSSTCVCVQNHYHRAKAQLQLNKYYYNKVVGLPSGGSNYRPKHVAVNVMNEYTLIYCVVLIGQSITNTGWIKTTREVYSVCARTCDKSVLRNG